VELADEEKAKKMCEELGWKFAGRYKETSAFQRLVYGDPNYPDMPRLERFWVQ
jgi:hypothetical protein